MTRKAPAGCKEPSVARWSLHLRSTNVDENPIRSPCSSLYMHVECWREQGQGQAAPYQSPGALLGGDT